MPKTNGTPTEIEAGVSRRDFLALALSLALPGWSVAAASASETDLGALANQAYLYLYPLVLMDLTRRRSTAWSLNPFSPTRPANSFYHAPRFPPASFRAVVRPNFDTLYSVAWLDLRDGPVVLTQPEIAGRYFVFQMLDMWTETFAAPGSRTTGGEAQRFVIASSQGPAIEEADLKLQPGFEGKVSVVRAPTPFVWVIGRIQTDGPDDFGAVRALQGGIDLYRLPARKGAGPAGPMPDLPSTSGDPPKIEIDRLSAEDFFAYAGQLLKFIPAHPGDGPILADLRRLGLVPGQNFDLGRLAQEQRKALESSPVHARSRLSRDSAMGRAGTDGWTMPIRNIGVYGDDYVQRAAVAREGLGANPPEDAVYGFANSDSAGRPLDGSRKYVIRFPVGQRPPAKAFWSITLYDPEGFPIENPVSRYSLSSWMPLKADPDGALTLAVQHDAVEGEGSANWLPAPDGPFTLTLRIYEPGSQVLDGTWRPPAIKPI